MIYPQFQKSVLTKSGKKLMLRYPRMDDAERLMRFINPIIRENAYILAKEEKSLAEEKEYIESCIQSVEKINAIYIYAEVASQIVGVADVRRERDKMSHVGLFGISISKEFRGDGLGSILMDEVLKQAKEVMQLEIVRLTCFAENTPALSLYKKKGFQEYGRLPGGLRHADRYIDQVEMYRAL